MRMKPSTTQKQAWGAWYVLTAFSFFSTSQAMAWFVYSSVPAASAAYFALSETEIALLLNWGCIVYVVVALPMLAVLSSASPAALRRVVRGGAVLVFLANLLRDIPTFVPTMHTTFEPFLGSSSSSSSFSESESFVATRPTGAQAKVAKVLLHTAQILNAAAGPAVMSPVSLLSEMYFTPRLFTLTTNIAYFANGFGTSLMFVVGPALAPTAERMPALMLFQTACAVVALVLVFAHFPLPAASTAAEAQPLLSDEQENQQQQSAWKRAKETVVDFLRGARGCLCHGSAAVATLCTGVQFGFAAGWAGCLPTVLMHLGVDSQTAGWLGAGEAGASLASSLAVGALAATPCLWWRYRAMAVVLWVLTVASFGAVSLFVPYPWAAQPVVQPSHTALFGVCFVCFGLAAGGLTPLYYEILAELTHPVSPSTSAGLVALLSNIATLLVVALSPVLSASWFLALVMAVLVLCAVLCSLFVKVRYRRRIAHQSSASRLLQIADPPVTSTNTTSD